MKRCLLGLLLSVGVLAVPGASTAEAVHPRTRVSYRTNVYYGAPLAHRAYYGHPRELHLHGHYLPPPCDVPHHHDHYYRAPRTGFYHSRPGLDFYFGF